MLCSEGCATACRRKSERPTITGGREPHRDYARRSARAERLPGKSVLPRLLLTNLCMLVRPRAASRRECVLQGRDVSSAEGLGGQHRDRGQAGRDGDAERHSAQRGGLREGGTDWGGSGRRVCPVLTCDDCERGDASPRRANLHQASTSSALIRLYTMNGYK